MPSAIELRFWQGNTGILQLNRANSEENTEGVLNSLFIVLNVEFLVLCYLKILQSSKKPHKKNQHKTKNSTLKTLPVTPATLIPGMSK